MRRGASADWVRERLPEILLPEGKGLLAVIEVYVDESERESGVFCVSSYGFMSAQAKKFSKKWSRLLNGRIFHMTDIVARQGEFANLSQAQSDSLIREAAKIISSRVSVATGLSCVVGEMERVAPKDEAGHRWFGFSPYAWLCYSTMLRLGGWVSNNMPGENIAYIFESGHRHMREANAVIEATIRNALIRDEIRYASHAFVPKRDSMPLQAADFLAWEWAKFYDETELTHRRDTRKSLIAILPKRRVLCDHFTGQRLEDYMMKVKDLGLRGAP